MKGFLTSSVFDVGEKSYTPVGLVDHYVHPMSDCPVDVFCIRLFFFVYRMGRLCGGAHEISGIKAPPFLCGGWLEGSWDGWVVVVWVMGWVGHGVGGCWVVVLWVPMTPPIMGGIRCPHVIF